MATMKNHLRPMVRATLRMRAESPVQSSSAGSANAHRGVQRPENVAAAIVIPGLFRGLWNGDAIVRRLLRGVQLAPTRRLVLAVNVRRQNEKQSDGGQHRA